MFLASPCSNGMVALSFFLTYSGTMGLRRRPTPPGQQWQSILTPGCLLLFLSWPLYVQLNVGTSSTSTALQCVVVVISSTDSNQLFVVQTTLVALMVPFFNAILGLLGSLGLFPLTVYYPVSMYIAKPRTRRGRSSGLCYRSLSSSVCLFP